MSGSTKRSIRSRYLLEPLSALKNGLKLRTSLFLLALRLSRKAIYNSLRALVHYIFLMAMALVFLTWMAMIMLVWLTAILPVVLGYRDPDVDLAIREQLDSGISFSLATKLEYELAENLHQLIPCAEMVKFGKSGTDVTTAAVRARARAYTKRYDVIMTGYHGWADWSMVTTNRRTGIPPDYDTTSIRLDYGGFQGIRESIQ